MMGFFKKKKRINVTDTFINCNRYQKLSCVNFLVGVSCIDGPPNLEELNCINKYVDIFRVTSQECTDRLNSFGVTQVIEDLKSLSFNQKQILFRISLEIIYIDSPPKKHEISFVETSFLDIGLNGQEQKEILRSVIKSGDFLSE